MNNGVEHTQNTSNVWYFDIIIEDEYKHVIVNFNIQKIRSSKLKCVDYVHSKIIIWNGRNS
jgi:hypothetical protein